MAFLKRAYAGVIHAKWEPQNWANFLDQNRATLANGSVRKASGAPNLVAQASQILQDDFTAAKYLLTHATIVASVDTEDVANVRLGAVQERGTRINRTWSNFRVTPESEGFVNNNHDGWDRPVLLKSYRTFIGGDSFLEHVQIPEQSKGKIIDAVARDIGPSVYIDILVANDRRHTSLIDDIESGRLSTLSMGCSCVSTQCTKCGNVATDETDLCRCIKYEKGNFFYDDSGTRRKIAELCGHKSIDPTAGINFIEASWVAVPAFKGAVLRNVLEPEVLSIQAQRQAAEILCAPPREWVGDDGTLKAAKLQTPTKYPTTIIAGDDFEPPPDPSGESGGEDTAPEEEEADDSVSTLEDEIEMIILDRVKKRLKDKLKGEQPAEGELATSTGENIIHQGSTKRHAKLAEGTSAIIRIARSDVELIDSIARLEQSFGIKTSREIYRTALRVGSTDSRTSLETYLARCAEVLDRQPTTVEAATLVRLGRILSLWKRT